jgi:hypothetical protein
VTAYLGFPDRVDLRYFLLSHVFLEHFLAYSANVKTQPGQTSLLQVFNHNDLEDLLPSGNIDKKYPTDVGDNATRTQNRLFRAAGYHYELVKAIRSFEGEALYDVARQKAVTKNIKQQMDLILPTFPRKPSFLIPKLGPLEGESKLEPFNRIICLFRFAKKMFTTSVFNAKLASRNVFKTSQPASSDYPPWMREGELEDVEPLLEGRQFPNRFRNR